MKKFNGYFLFYKGRDLKQHCFRGASEIQIENWYKIFQGPLYKFIGKSINETDKNTPYHLGW